MTILVTGSNGSLGRVICTNLLNNNVKFVPYSHSMSLDCVDWDSIDIVINCAATVPGPNVDKRSYVGGNIIFLQKLISFCSGKKLIHFSSLSELYKSECYQITKMIGNSLLLANISLFSGLKIIPLPTLDDTELISSIVEKAEMGLMPTVDELKYNFLSYENVAIYVFSLLDDFFSNNISSFYVYKNLYYEVEKVVGSEKILRGRVIDRTLSIDGVFCVSPELLSLLNS